MDLSKMSNDKKLQLCKYYFYGGFGLLPFLWAVNAIWFAQQAFCAPPYEEQKQIKKYVILSGVLALISISAYVAWIIVFQTYRVEWGQFADSISFVIPAGVP
ncbi:gamma-secretase subunit pen-2 [Phymastichus coffea]|uniref:gamma-secretase subunit pen-2 n=1 Tax=Phymastichus coffea TaxID=108790 RepID=UPI00273CDA99|nr:gamma-secretase subunit pen-2 [Phymastichus coffea]